MPDLQIIIIKNFVAFACQLYAEFFIFYGSISYFLIEPSAAEKNIFSDCCAKWRDTIRIVFFVFIEMVIQSYIFEIAKKVLVIWD